MLDLQPRIHFDEENILAVGDEFDRPGSDIGDRSRRLACGGTYRIALRTIERRRWGLLDHLLMPPLQRAFALEQRQQIAVAVADDLHFDVPWILDEFFDQHAVVAEGRLGLTLGADHCGGKLARRAHDPHASATTAR